MTLFSGFWLTSYQFFIVGTLIGAGIFAVGYGFTSKWWKTIQGRHVFYFGLVLFLAFLLIGLRVIFGDFPGRAVISYTIVVALFIAVWWRTVLWFTGEFSAWLNKRKSVK